MVEYHPISAKYLSRLHQFGPKVLSGIFLGYAVHAGGIWKGDLLIADIEEFEQMGASELHARRLNAKEVLTPMKGDNFIFPVADGTGKNLWRRSTSENIHLTPGSPRPTRRTRNSSRITRQVFFQHTSTITTRWLNTGWWWSWKWFLIHFRRFYLPSSRGTQSQTVRVERRIIF